MANVDEWKWKLGILLANDSEREIVSRDKRDRRDYEQISNLAKRMGLYRCVDKAGVYLVNSLLLFMDNVLTLSLFLWKSEIYGKVVVASKVPLPNYRPDLDDKRPQREVKCASLCLPKTIKLFFL